MSASYQAILRNHEDDGRYRVVLIDEGHFGYRWSAVVTRDMWRLASKEFFSRRGAMRWAEKVINRDVRHDEKAAALLAKLQEAHDGGGGIGESV